MFENLRINHFCCCCSTRTGSLVIGVLGWMGSLLQAMTLANSYSVEKNEITQTEEGTTIEKQSRPNIVTILISILMFGVSVALVIGVYKDNRKLILPWLVIKFLECVFLTIITIVVFYMIYATRKDVTPVVIIFVIIGLLSFFFWHCWFCVWSHYMDLGETTLTNVPTGNSIPMTEPSVQQYPQYPVDVKPTSPPQEMV